MHGRLCSKTEENGAVDSLEMPVPTTSGGRTRRTGLLTVMERPPGKTQLLFIVLCPFHFIANLIRKQGKCFHLFYACQYRACIHPSICYNT